MSMKPMTYSDEPEVKAFHCKNCGAPLDIPKNAKGVVVCQNCNTENVIANLVKNMAILEKENISCGISLDSKSGYELQICMKKALTSDSCVPLDILEKTVVKKEEHIMIPAYYFHCNASAPFSYEAGTQKERYNSSKGQMEKYTEWQQAFGQASASADLVAPGNKEYEDVFHKLYSDLSPKDFVDIESLEYPADAVILSYDYPQNAAFDKYIKPEMEDRLHKNAEKSMHGEWRGISMTGGIFDKSDMTRVIIGLYRLVCEYNEKEFTVFVSSDKNRFVCDSLPQDKDRVRKLSELYQGIRDAKKQRLKKLLPFAIPIVVSVILGVVINPAILLIGIVASIIAMIIYNKKVLAPVVKAGKERLKEFEDEVETVRENFKGSIQGIQKF
ncbi:MAG: hypothetical protein J5441_04500 [Clostridia bacterium]|nr:hypothetical protein [Clostridia bacterium]